jgi:predicted ATP-dependent serine protease
MWSNNHLIMLSSSDNLVQQVALVHEHRPRLVIIDSIQDTRQARFSAGIANMMSTYKAIAGDLHCSFWLISHVNTEGKLKGGTYVGHKVDIELIAEKLLNPSEFVVKCGEKNRYGATGKNAVFMHTPEGIVAVAAENHRAFAMSSHNLMAKAAVPMQGAPVLRRASRNDLPAGGLPESREDE